MLTLIWVISLTSPVFTSFTISTFHRPWVSGLFVSCHLYQDGEETLEFEVKGHLALQFAIRQNYLKTCYSPDTMERSRHNIESSEYTSLRPESPELQRTRESGAPPPCAAGRWVQLRVCARGRAACQQQTQEQSPGLSASFPPERCTLY